MTALLKSGDRTPVELRALLERLQRPQNLAQLRCWIEAPDGWGFDWWPGLLGNLRWCTAGRLPTEISADAAVQRSQAGRLFALDGELRWRIIPALGENCCRIVFLGTHDWIAGELEDHSTLLEPLESARTEQFLWGQQTAASPEEWIELRIPHRFRYPIAGEPRGVKLVAESWNDNTGNSQFMRLCDLKPIEESV